MRDTLKIKLQSSAFEGYIPSPLWPLEGKCQTFKLVMGFILPEILKNIENICNFRVFPSYIP